MRGRRSGFTLFEVMLGIVILVVMAGGIFGSVGAVISAVESLQSGQENQMNREALVELLRKNFLALPPRAIVLLATREDNGTFLSELTLENAPASFSWGAEAGYFGWIVLGQERAADGLFRLQVLRMDSDETVRSRQVPQKLTLAEGLRVFRWEFFNSHDRRWMGKWDNRARPPNLVRLEFQFQGDDSPVQVTFALPWTSPSNALVSGE